MAKRLVSLAIFSLFLLIFLSTPSKSFAMFDAYKYANDNNLKPVTEYCKLRSGNQMNLETWYSGKCKGSFQEMLGFSDMVFLDLLNDFDEGARQTAFLPFGSFLAEMSNSQPASATQYIAQISQNLAKHSVIPSAYAAGEGFGFQSLGPVLTLWKLFRDIVYLLFVLAFVIYGFMIMFRMKISAQAVVSIQTAIPTIIVTLLLITFSYAIAGLLIDLSYLTQEVVLNAFFSKIDPATTTVQIEFFGFKPSFTLPSFDPFISMFTKNDHPIASLYIGRYGGIFMPLVYLLMALTVGDAVSKIAGVMMPSSGDPWIDTLEKTVLSNPLINFLIWIVLFIAVLYTFFKIVYMLMQAFVMTIFQVIFSPFILLQDIFPGRDAFGGWVRSIFSNIIAFPATIFCFLLSFIFLGPITNDTGGLLKAVMTPPFRLFVPSPQFVYKAFQITGGDFNGAFTVPPPLGFIGGVNGESMAALIGIGIFLMTPKIVEMLQEALKVPAFKYGAAIGEALNYGYGPLNEWVISPMVGQARNDLKTHGNRAAREAYRGLKGAFTPSGSGTPTIPSAPGGAPPTGNTPTSTTTA